MLIDTTLREGEQQYGVYFSAARKRTLVRLSLAAGVEEVELGAVGRDAALPQLVTLARRLARPGQAVNVWCAARSEDLRAAAAMGADRICLSVPVSDAHIQKKLAADREELLARLDGLLDASRRLGVSYLSVGLEDVTRADRAFALEVARRAQAGGAARVRLSDTVGILNPAETAALVRDFRDALAAARPQGPALHLAVHCHNDFGLGTANALAALDAGADFADATALGLGERAGLASLEQLAGYMVLRRGQASYDLGAIRDLCAAVAATPGVTMRPNAPVVGERLFWAESGLHVDGLYKAPELYEPFDPKAVGLTRKLAVGKKSGLSAMRRKLAEMGIATSGPELETLLGRVRSFSDREGRVLDDDELGRLAN